MQPATGLNYKLICVVVHPPKVALPLLLSLPRLITRAMFWKQYFRCLPFFSKPVQSVG